jgi:hypothetical protein
MSAADKHLQWLKILGYAAIGVALADVLYQLAIGAAAPPTEVALIAFGFDAALAVAGAVALVTHKCLLDFAARLNELQARQGRADPGTASTIRRPGRPRKQPTG